MARYFRLLAAVLVLAAAMGCRPRDEAPGWNVVLIVVDTLRADHLPAYGYDRPTTPFLDRFAADAVIFQEARSEAGCTFPSVNSLLTSKHPQRYMRTMKQHGWAIPEDIPTLAEMLQAAGYSAAAVSSSPVVRANPSRRNPDGGYDAGFSEFDDSCMGKAAACVNRQAFGLLEGLAEPFLLYLHYFEPHIPYRPPKTHPRTFAADSYPKSWVADGRLLPLDAMLFYDGRAVEFTDADLAHTLDLYDEEILYLDSQLAKLIERLEADGVLDRTLLVLAADHGEEFLEHDHIGHCRDLAYDTVLKTPLFLWIPGFERPGSNRALAQNLDIVPTILDYLEIDAAAYGLEGQSLRPVIEEGAAARRYAFGLQRYARSVTDGRFKLTYNIKTGEVRLFDLLRDPGELTDVAARRPQLADQLTEVLLRWVESTEGDLDVAERIEKATDVTERLRALGYL